MHTVRCTSRVLEESIFGPFWQNFGHNYGHLGIGIALFWNDEAIMHPKTLVVAKNGNLCDKNWARYGQFKLRVFFYPFFLKNAKFNNVPYRNFDFFRRNIIFGIQSHLHAKYGFVRPPWNFWTLCCDFLPLAPWVSMCDYISKNNARIIQLR